MHLVGFIIRITYVTLKRLGKTFRVRLQKYIAVLRHRCSSHSYRTYWQDGAVNVFQCSLFGRQWQTCV